MPDRRRHRGPHPADADLFAPRWHDALRAAVHDLSWLLSRGYADPSALALVGNRYGLRERQRMAVWRASCSDAARAARRAREVDGAALRGEGIGVDGYNVLITVEAALAGGVLLLSRDGCLRDLASLHGHFKRVEETHPAIEHLGGVLEDSGVASCTLYLDRPVSNSGRLAAVLRGRAADRGWPWDVRLVASADRALQAAPDVVATADSHVLDAGVRWFNLARHVVEARVPDASVLDLR